MNCCIDQGNTKTKISFFQKEELYLHVSFFNKETHGIQDCLQNQPFEKGIYSSSADVADFIDQRKFLVLTKDTPIPISLNYKTPETLGTDRIALAVGASTLYPSKNCLIISVGTCITIDLVDKKHVYQGGIISPGLDMKFKAMHEQTANLPRLAVNSKRVAIPLVGKSTQESMESGVIHGTIAELKSTIEQFQAIYNDLTVIITGGDAYLFEFPLKNEIFAQQNLQAIGLNRILLYNAK